MPNTLNELPLEILQPEILSKVDTKTLGQLARVSRHFAAQAEIVFNRDKKIQQEKVAFFDNLEKKRDIARAERAAAQETYKQARLDRTNALKAIETNHQMKLLIAGNGETKRKLFEKFDDSYNPAMMPRWETMKLPLELGAETFVLTFTELSSSERYELFLTPYYKNACGIIIAFDSSDRETFDRINYLVEQAKQHAFPLAAIQIVDVNRSFNRDRSVSEYEIKRFANNGVHSTHICDPNLLKAFANSIFKEHLVQQAKARNAQQVQENQKTSCTMM